MKLYLNLNKYKLNYSVWKRQTKYKRILCLNKIKRNTINLIKYLVKKLHKLKISKKLFISINRQLTLWNYKLIISKRSVIRTKSY